MRTTMATALIWIGLAAFAPGSAGAARAALGFQVGAARSDVTPPPFDRSADAHAFPACGPEFTGRRLFAFEEPYVDLDGSGRFHYPDPFCDANHNGRWDGVFLSGGVDHLAASVHDPIDARAIAIGDGRRTVVIVSVVAQGLFENYTSAMRARAMALRPGISAMVVSANHNESSPDTIGIYGAPSVADVFGLASGIDDYYMDYLVRRVADAAVAAYDARRPAGLYAGQVRLPRNVGVQLSKNFPTTDDRGGAAAIDPKLGILQARDARGRTIVTAMSLAAHNQEIGHASAGGLGFQLSSDWPGYFEHAIERLAGHGLGVFLVGDNGSEEDPYTVPRVSKALPGCPGGCYEQARASGEALARAVAIGARRLAPLPAGAVRAARRTFLVPLENNLFKAEAAAGLFGKRETYLAGAPAGRLGDSLKTEVNLIDIGPGLQVLANPGESFPALMLGSPWGIEDAGCPSRPNPPVPTWHARAPLRFQLGLANDLIGYLIPAWGFSSTGGVYNTDCVNDGANRDPRGHQHKLEDESVGFSAGNLVAQQLTALLEADGRDPAAQVIRGRFVRADGSLSPSPAGARGAWLPGLRGGTLLATPGLGSIAGRRVDGHAVFMDYDGVAQRRPDVTTRGMLVRDGAGRVTARYYLDVYPRASGR